MLHFFSGKKFLIDHLEGFIDIHNHILPGIDDGAKTVEDSINLLNGFSEIGINRFWCTPHIMENYYPNTHESIHSSLALLNNSIKMNDMGGVHINVAAEHMIDSNFETILEQNKALPIGPYHLLVEMSYLQPSLNFKRATEKVASQNYFVLLAHPERYNFLHKQKKKFFKYKEQGIQFQMNMLSLGDFYGKDVNKTALKLLDEGLIDYLASDVHNMNQLNTLKELKVTKKTLDQLLPIINNTIETFY